MSKIKLMISQSPIPQIYPFGSLFHLGKWQSIRPLAQSSKILDAFPHFLILYQQIW